MTMGLLQLPPPGRVVVVVVGARRVVVLVEVVLVVDEVVIGFLRVGAVSELGHTSRPSVLQRLSVCLLHARRRPPAATHAAISSLHACRHCLASEPASAADAM